VSGLISGLTGQGATSDRDLTGKGKSGVIVTPEKPGPVIHPASGLIDSQPDDVLSEGTQPADHELAENTQPGMTGGQDDDAFSLLRPARPARRRTTRPGQPPWRNA
jgi:hypothetical protein